MVTKSFVFFFGADISKKEKLRENTKNQAWNITTTGFKRSSVLISSFWPWLTIDSCWFSAFMLHFTAALFDTVEFIHCTSAQGYDTDGNKAFEFSFGAYVVSSNLLFPQTLNRKIKLRPRRSSVPRGLNICLVLTHCCWPWQTIRSC